MMSLAEFRTTLGDFGQSLTDERVELLYKMECQWADAIIEKWLRDRISYAQKLLENSLEKNTIVSEHNIWPEAFLLPGTSGIEMG